MPLAKLENGVNINYQLEGKEKNELLLLIHGYGSWLQGYDEITPFLTKKFLVLRSDLRGHGESDKPIIKNNYEETRKLYKIEQFAEDNYLLLKSLGLLERYGQIIVYGHSMGGITAQVFALRYPHIVKKLILGSTAPSMYSEGMERTLNDYRTGKLGDLKEAFMLLARSAYTLRFKKNHPEALEKDVEPKLKCPSDVLFGAMENFVYDFDVRENLSTLDIPVLIITGNKDSLVPSKRSHELNELIPNSKLVIFEKQNHGINVEIPEKVAKEIINFVEN